MKNKFDSLIDQCTGNVDVLMVTETNINQSFPNFLFKTTRHPIDSIEIPLGQNNGICKKTYSIKSSKSRIASYRSIFCTIKSKEKEMTYKLLLKFK